MASQLGDGPKDEKEKDKGALQELIEKGKAGVDLLKKPKSGSIFKSVFRHKLDESPRNRSLA